MYQDNPTSPYSRRDTLRFGGAAGLALAAGAALRSRAAAQTPQAAGDVSIANQTVSLAAAQQMLDAAQAKATELGVPVVITVVDESGMLKAFHRMDGVVSPAPVDISPMKAYTAAAFRTPTHQLAETNLSSPERLASLPNVPHVTLLGGGYPIMDGDVVVGGIGVSGATSEMDMQIAEAGLAALGQ